MHFTHDDLRIREVYEQADDSDESDRQHNNDCWVSLFDPRVVEVFDEIYDLSMDDDDDDFDDDDGDDEDEDQN